MSEQFNTFKAEVKRAFEAYLAANGGVRERAKAHGEALARLRAACAEQKVHFVETLKELGVVVSTAYQHLQLSERWDDATEVARTMGVEFDALCIKEVLDLVRTPRKPKPGGAPAAVETAGYAPAPPGVSAPAAGKPKATGEGADEADEVFAHSGSAPQADPPAAPPLPAPLQKLVDRKLVRVVHAERGRAVRVEVGDLPVLVVLR